METSVSPEGFQAAAILTKQQLLERQFDDVQRIAHVGTWQLLAASNQLICSDQACRIAGIGQCGHDASVDTYLAAVHPDDRSTVLAAIEQAVHASVHAVLEHRVVWPDGSVRTLRVRGVPFRDEDGNVGMAGTVQNIAGKQCSGAARQAISRRRPLKEGSAVCCSDVFARQQQAQKTESQNAERFRIVASTTTDIVNKGAERLFGWSAQEAIGKTKAQLGMVEQQEFDTAYPVLLQRGNWSGESVKRRKDGSSLTVESHLTRVRDDAGRPQSVLSIQTDITQRKQAEQEIKALAFFDPLTGLPNRLLLLERLRHVVATCRRNRRAGALMFIDLDNFKSLNDTLGHDQGDVLLQQVALRLRASVPRASDTVARHGGDEFVIVLEDLSVEPEHIVRQAETVAEKIQAGFEATAAVNISACQFRQNDFVEQVLQVIERNGADPNKLTLELTENLLVADLERTEQKMNCLKAKGISFALDDFDIGYSSLSYLKCLPLNQLKINKLFVQAVLTDPSDAAIARTVLVLGHTLGLEVIAEGVETASQRDFLARIGCRAYQGYLFSHPVPAEQF